MEVSEGCGVCVISALRGRDKRLSKSWRPGGSVPDSRPAMAIQLDPIPDETIQHKQAGDGKRLLSLQKARLHTTPGLVLHAHP